MNGKAVRRREEGGFGFVHVGVMLYLFTPVVAFPPPLPPTTGQAVGGFTTEVGGKAEYVWYLHVSEGHLTWNCCLVAVQTQRVIMSAPFVRPPPIPLFDMIRFPQRPHLLPRTDTVRLSVDHSIPFAHLPTHPTNQLVKNSKAAD